MLLWQPMPEAGFWCQAGTVPVPVVDGGAKMKYLLADKCLNKPIILPVNSRVINFAFLLYFAN